MEAEDILCEGSGIVEMNRILKLGSIKHKPVFGIVRIALYVWNPFENWFGFKRTGRLVFMRIPGIRIVWVTGEANP
jgi:hypothetical protein